jgi:ParB/RepB/Spo0J family partition protein
MTTAVHQKPPAKAAEAPAVLYQGFVPVANIDVVSNVRKKYDPAKLQELTESVREHGVNTPIELRPGKEKGRYEVVAGHRRLKAAQAVGLAQIPAIVKDTTPEEAAVHQVIENIQREDLRPMEEARGFLLLTQPSKDGKAPAKYTVEQLAPLIDKSVGYVYRTLKLLELPKAIIDKIENGEMTPAHGHQLLRIHPDQREKVFEDWQEDYSSDDNFTAKGLGEYIDDYLGQDLAGARFPTKAPYAGQTACVGCQFNTASQVTLFEGVEKGSRCLNRTCFDTKQEQHKKDVIAEVKTKFPDNKVLISNGYTSVGHWVNGNRIARELKAGEKVTAKDVIVVSKETGDMFVAKPSEESSAQQPAAAPKPKSEKEKFIEKAVEEHIEEAIEKAKAKATEKQMLAVLNDGMRGWMESELKKRKLFPITTKTIVQAMYWVEILNGNCYGDELANDLGVDLKKERAEATKKAESKWLADHPKAAAKDAADKAAAEIVAKAKK